MGLTELIAIAVVLNLVLWIIGLVDVARSQFADESTKVIWFVIVFVFYGIGAVLYFTFARKRRLKA